MHLFDGQFEDALETLRLAKLRMEFILKAGQIGVWDWDVINDRLHWSPHMCALFSVDPDAELTYDSFINRVVERDREKVNSAIQRSLENGEHYEINYMIEHEGIKTMIHARGLRYPEDPSLPARWLVGICIEGGVL